MNNNQTSEKLTFRELISRYTIEIPIIQRDYAQGREDKADLRTNFLNALVEGVNGKLLELDFIYGSVKDAVFQPLDGQQRLTTLFLLHWYIATKENKLDNELKNTLSKFSYETRTSSREFCNDLINKRINLSGEQEISEIIIDSSWFFLSWKRDPTIKAMLKMLDAIQKTFTNKNDVWEKLNNISFNFIELRNFGLSDDLYIKMNARGKPLTDFENFKAKFEQYIKQQDWEKNCHASETFSHQIDTVCTDLFWHFRNEENIFDEQILNYFRTFALNSYALKENVKDDIFRHTVDLLRGKQNDISFHKYLELGCFDNDYFKILKSVFNKISQKDGLKTFLPDTTYIDETKIFNDAINNNLSYPDLVTAFAYYQYIGSEESIEAEKLTNWMRIVRNLVEGSRPYLFNNANEFANALRSINELLPYRNSIVEHFAQTQNNSLSGFISEQIIEEKLKAKLFQSEEWKKVIIEFENHSYFNGQIGFLLHWSTLNNEPNLDTFTRYTKKLKVLFANNGLTRFDNFIFERALLATGDYLLHKGRNYSFLINNERDISWKRLLRDNNEKREILKRLLDSISIDTLEEDLQTIINDFNDADDWRFHFVKQPEMISACGSQKLIRFNENKEFSILLLGSSTTSGYHKEYYSYSLYVALKSKLVNASYVDQRSANDWKYFEYNNKQIAFDCETTKFIWTQNNDWGNKQEFKNSEDVLLQLTQ